jgi:hypothetical protein
MLEPSGICTSTRTSGRSEVGKNCFFTAPMPTAAARKATSTRPATSHLLATDQAMSLRTRRYRGVS